MAKAETGILQGGRGQALLVADLARLGPQATGQLEQDLVRIQGGVGTDLSNLRSIAYSSIDALALAWGSLRRRSGAEHRASLPADGTELHAFLDSGVILTAAWMLTDIDVNRESLGEILISLAELAVYEWSLCGDQIHAAFTLVMRSLRDHQASAPEFNSLLALGLLAVQMRGARSDLTRWLRPEEAAHWSVQDGASKCDELIRLWDNHIQSQFAHMLLADDLLALRGRVRSLITAALDCVQPPCAPS